MFSYVCERHYGCFGFGFTEESQSNKTLNERKNEILEYECTSLNTEVLVYVFCLVTTSNLMATKRKNTTKVNLRYKSGVAEIYSTKLTDVFLSLPRPRERRVSRNPSPLNSA